MVVEVHRRVRLTKVIPELTLCPILMHVRSFQTKVIHRCEELGVFSINRGKFLGSKSEEQLGALFTTSG